MKIFNRRDHGRLAWIWLYPYGRAVADGRAQCLLCSSVMENNKINQ